MIESLLVLIVDGRMKQAMKILNVIQYRTRSHPPSNILERFSGAHPLFFHVFLLSLFHLFFFLNLFFLIPFSFFQKAEEASRAQPVDPTRPPSPLVGPSGEPLEKPAAEKPQPVPLAAAASAIPMGLNQKARKVG